MVYGKMPRLSIAPSVRTSASVGIPMSEPGRLGLFINRHNVTTLIKSCEFFRGKNQVSTLDIELRRYNGSLEDIVVGNRFVVVYNQIVLGTGILEKPANTNRGTIKFAVRLLGKAGIDLEKVLIDTLDYTDIDSEDIVNNLCSENRDGSSPWVLEPGTVDSVGGSTVRGNNTNSLEVTTKFVNDLGLWWNIAHPAPTSGIDYREEDRLEVRDWTNATLYPEKNSVHFRPFNSGNCKDITKDVDTSKGINYLRLLGAGDGANQLESICFHATLIRSKLAVSLDTWLTANVAISATTISVTNTAGFPSSGSIVIGTDTITYSGKTDTTFTGCANVAQTHVSNAEVINVSPSQITVYDSSLFPTSGNLDVWIGNEKISITTLSNNKSTGVISGTITRADSASDRLDTYPPSSRFYYAHGRNVPVYDAQYLPTVASAQTGSSIKLWSLLTSTPYDNTIIDQNALDVAGGNLIDVYYVPPETVTLESESASILNHIELGDMLRVEDGYSSGALDDYRLYEIRIRKDQGLPRVLLTLGNSTYSFSTELAQAKREIGNIAVWGQGVPQTITVNEHDDCQGSNISWTPDAGSPSGSDDDAADPRELFPLVMEFEIPDEAIKVDKAKLSYYTSPYRAYASTTNNTGAHTHTVTTQTSSAGGGLDFSSYPSTYSASVGVAPVANTVTVGTGFTDIGAKNFNSSPDLEGAVIYFSIDNNGSEDAIYQARAIWTKSGSTSLYFPGESTSTINAYISTGAYVDNTVDGVQWMTIHCHGNLEGGNLKLQMKRVGYSGSTDVTYSIFPTYAHFHTIDEDDHTHTVSGQTASSGGAHEHSVTFGITEGDNNFDVIKIAIDDGNGYVEKTSDIETDIGHTLSTSSEKSIDITKYFGDSPGTKKVKVLGASSSATIRFGRIQSVLTVKHYETNRT